jgi:hypothetical protein
MKTLATFSSSDTAWMLTGLLGKQGIPFRVSKIDEDENGLEAYEVLVDDEHYETGCEVAEQWVAACEKAYETSTARRCPVCNSPHVGPVHDVEGVIQCRDCGHVL